MENNKENNQNENENGNNKAKEIESQLIESIKNKENATKERLEKAEEINFKAMPDQVIKTDEYGFFSDEKEAETQ